MSERLSRERLDTIIRMIVSARGPKVADEIADHIAALEAENAEWKASFDLYNKAIRRGDDAWRQAHPDMDCYPDTGEMVKWLCDRNDALEAENERLRAWFKKLVNKMIAIDSAYGGDATEYLEEWAGLMTIVRVAVKEVGE
jgi:hypothetical protein